MIRSTTLPLFLFGIGAGIISLSNAALSQDNAVSPVAGGQGKPTEAVSEAVATPDGEITTADRMLRLENSVEADKKQLGELERDLTKAQAEEEATSGVVQKLAAQIENTTTRLQKAKEAGDQTTADRQQTLLSELELEHGTAKEQFNLAIQTRQTVQEQIATLQQKIAMDQESLDKLKGVPSSEPAEVEPSTSIEPSTLGPSTPSPDSQPDKTPAPPTKRRRQRKKWWSVRT